MRTLKVATIVTQPQLTLAEIKTFLRVDYTTDDTLITNLITNAFDYFEQITGISLNKKNYVFWTDSADENQVLPIKPMVSIEKIYIDEVLMTPVADYYKGNTEMYILNLEGAELTVEFTAGDTTFNKEYYNIITELIAYWYEFRNGEKLPEYLQQKINNYCEI